MRGPIAGLLVALLCAVGCTKRQETGIAINPALRRLIPPDTKAIAGVDLDRIKTTALYQRYQSQLNFPLLNGSAERFGIDPRRDISAAIALWNGEQITLLAQGRFQPTEVQSRVSALGVPQTQYGKYRLLGDQQHALLFVSNSVAVAGAAAAVRRVADLAGTGQGGIPEELQQRLGSLPKMDQIWEASGTGGLPFARFPANSSVGSLLSNVTPFITGTSCGLGLDGGVRFLMNISCTNTAGGVRVRDAVRAAVGFGRLMTKSNQQNLLQIYDAIQVEQKNDLVQVSANLSPEQIDTLLRYVRGVEKFPYQ